MSLRARLLLGTALIAVVLAVAAVAIARTTRAHLVDQVDAQLVTAGPQIGDERGRPGFGPRSLSRFFVGDLTEDGALARRPYLTSDEAPEPLITGVAST